MVTLQHNTRLLFRRPLRLPPQAPNVRQRLLRLRQLLGINIRRLSRLARQHTRTSVFHQFSPPVSQLLRHRGILSTLSRYLIIRSLSPIRHRIGHPKQAQHHRPITVGRMELTTSLHGLTRLHRHQTVFQIGHTTVAIGRPNAPRGPHTVPRANRTRARFDNNSRRVGRIFQNLRLNPMATAGRRRIRTLSRHAVGTHVQTGRRPRITSRFAILRTRYLQDRQLNTRRVNNSGHIRHLNGHQRKGVLRRRGANTGNSTHHTELLVRMTGIFAFRTSTRLPSFSRYSPAQLHWQTHDLQNLHNILPTTGRDIFSLRQDPTRALFAGNFGQLKLPSLTKGTRHQRNVRSALSEVSGFASSK